MSAWKSRWSWVRLVNSASSKWIASARCSDQRVRGDLHRAGAVAALEHPPEGRLQVDRLGRRPLDLLLDPADHLLDRAQQPALDAGRLEDLAEQEGGRRLAVGAGDPDDPQLRGRVALEARRQRRHRRPRVGDHDLRHRRARARARRPAPPPRPRPPAAANSCPSAFSPAHAEEQRPRPDLAAVVGEGGDLDRRVADGPPRLERRRASCVQPHRRDSR